MSKTKENKCNGSEYCKSLSRHINGKTLRIQIVERDFKTVGQLVSLHGTTENGVMLNYCPFCGGKIEYIA